MPVLRLRFVLSLMLFGMLLPAFAPLAEAGDFVDDSEYTYQVWARTDLPVAEGVESRTWMWGPEPIDSYIEEYEEGLIGLRYVEYYDKARMEITNPDGDPNSIWYVTNGLLVVELISGLMQVGDNEFIERDPAFINVAGDSDDLFGITYSMLDDYLDDPPLPLGEVIIQSFDFGDDPTFGDYGAVAAHLDPVTNHTIASPFWEFMNSSGTIYDNGSYTTGDIFPDPLFATGRPITEPYWAVIKVGGTYTDVLLQCFERRCLTYTPANPTEWQVEAGNVGLHYHDWRYDDESPPDFPVPGEMLFGTALDDQESGSEPDGDYFVEDGTYHLRANPDGLLYRYIDAGDDPFTDAWVDLEMRLVSSPNPDAYACLMTRLDSISQDYSYDFCLGADGWTFAFYEQFNPHQVETLLPLELRDGSADPNQWVRLSIVTRGEAIWFLIDDELVGSTTFTGPPGGTVGFYVLNPGTTPVEFEFRDLYVWALE